MKKKEKKKPTKEEIAKAIKKAFDNQSHYLLDNSLWMKKKKKNKSSQGETKSVAMKE